VHTRLKRPLPAALAGAVVAAAITAAVLVLPASTRTSNSSETFQAALSGSPAARGATARAVLATSSTGTRVRLHVRNLRGDPDAVYELWCVRDDGTKVSAGTFRVDARGQASVDLTTAAVPGEYHRMSVERHAVQGNGQAVMAGEIHYGSA
jgi:anti-sigma-K factor RskA